MVRGDPLLGVSDRTPESSFPLTCLYLEVGRILERPEITESTPPSYLVVSSEYLAVVGQEAMEVPLYQR